MDAEPQKTLKPIVVSLFGGLVAYFQMLVG